MTSLTDKVIIINPSAPSFDPDAWNTDEIGPLAVNTDLTDTNCYEYAVSGKNTKRDAQTANPGEVGGDITHFIDRPDYSKENLINQAVQDGLKPVGEVGNSAVLPANKPGFYTVALYAKKAGENHEGDFHWIRQDAEGGWSEKLGSLQVQKVADESTGRPYNTETFAPPLLHQSSEGSQNKYEFVSYFQVPEKGLDVGFDKAIENLVAKGDFKAALEAEKSYKLDYHSVGSERDYNDHVDSLDPATYAALESYRYKQMATTFKELPKDAALEKHPELEPAYVTRDAMHRVVDVTLVGRDQAQIDAAKQGVNESIARSIEAKSIPSPPEVLTTSIGYLQSER